MDFARKISKSDEPLTWKRSRMPIITTRDNPLSESDASLSEDRRLVNWKRWLADRQRRSRRIELVTGRSQIDQLQGSSERHRAYVETKELMEHASIPVPVIPDKYRGGPEFWRTAELLPDRGDDSLPEVSLTFTRKQLNLPPDLTRIGLPDLTAKERDLVGLKIKEEPWRRDEYLKTRKLELAREISLLLPKEPEIAALAVRGRAFRKKKPRPRIPLISITKPDEEESCEDVDQTTILKIQDREFIWRKCSCGTEATDAEAIMWSVTFESKIDERVEKEISLENRGSRVILYHWRDSSCRLTGATIRKRSSPFFFNKTRGLVLPGQFARIKVWYRSRVHGVSTECWRLVTEPRLSPSEFVFRFWGCAVDGDTESTDDRAIDEYLDRRVRDSIVRSIVEEVVAGVEHSQPPEPVYKTLFLESDLFSSLNPRYFYHPSVVMQLREMHREIADENAPAWNLSLDILRNTLLQIGETSYRRDMLARFYELCKRCLRPTLHDVTRDNKSDAVYDVLCAFANLFEAESDFVKNNSLIREKQPVATLKVDHKPQRSTSFSRGTNNNLREARGAKSTDQSQNIQTQNKQGTLDLNLQPYREAFFIRMYKALEEAVGRACAIVDSFNRLNRPEKQS
ncbi:MYCBP-associated protein-like [Odontomachus brunneus]|uniref:MYCBP-associated protein-like n=1 Tax=Odontomachus brunneus TaxID=486640 RepID=UPI0013F1F51B|nr:MYCBP-associated protein-like [Odontomachus brunneus]